MRTPMLLLELNDTLRQSMRALRADTSRAYRNANRHYLKRRVSPFMISLQYPRSRNASVLDVAKECLSRLRRARALSICEFLAGDQINVETVAKELNRSIERFLVLDVEWTMPTAAATRSGRSPRTMNCSSAARLRCRHRSWCASRNDVVPRQLPFTSTQSAT